jgi:hypothetical protein
MVPIALWTALSAHAGVVVNEVLADPDSPGQDLGFEWIELYNSGPSPVSLEGWRIERAKSSWEDVGADFTGRTLDVGAFLTVGEEYSGADVLVPKLDLGNGSNGDGVRLLAATGDVVDTVIYGESNADLLVDDFGDVAESVAPIETGLSTARASDGLDTQMSGNDFVVGEPSMGLPNPVVVPPVCVPGGQVVVNEFLPDPDAEGGDAGHEWVELFNAGASDASLDGWVIAAGTSSASEKFAFPGGVVLGAGDFLLVGEDQVAGADYVASLGLGNAGSSADAVVLLDCEGTVVDTVIYGSPNTDGWVDDLGQVTESTAPKAGPDESVARIADGVDTQDCGVDFAISLTPTPGGPNPVVEPVVCVPSRGDVVLNELLTDAEGADADQEWVELYNRGTEAVSVAGWTLTAGTSDFESIDVVLPGGTEIGPGDWLVVGGSLVLEADVVASFSIGNGTDGDGVRLADCEGAVVDTVVYADDEGNLDALPDDAGAVGLPAERPGESESLARVTDGVDSDAPADWQVAGAPTPGATNVRPPGQVPDDPIGGCGCGAPPPSDAGGAAGEPPGRGCATGPSPGVALLAALFLRRRSR